MHGPKIEHQSLFHLVYHLFITRKKFPCGVSVRYFLFTNSVSVKYFLFTDTLSVNNFFLYLNFSASLPQYGSTQLKLVHFLFKDVCTSYGSISGPRMYLR